MTIYIPQLSELPTANMRALDPTAQCSITAPNGVPTAFAYEWTDLRVVVNVLPAAELAQHLQGFVGFIRHGCAALHRPMDESLERRILSTTLVLGFVVERTVEPDGWRDRVQDMIGTIASNTRALVFWEGGVFDEHARQLFPS